MIEGRRYRHQKDKEHCRIGTWKELLHKDDEEEEKRQRVTVEEINKKDAKGIRVWKREEVMVKVRTRSRNKA
jgi:hypothetical protein